MQQFLHLLNKVYTGNCELAIFVVRNNYFPASLKGTRQGPEEGKNQWKHSSAIICPKTSEESDF